MTGRGVGRTCRSAVSNWTSRLPLVVSTTRRAFHQDCRLYHPAERRASICDLQTRRFTTRDGNGRIERDRGDEREPTVYALSTPSGPGAIAIVRVSGPLSRHVYHALCPDKQLPRPRMAAVRALYRPQSNQHSPAVCLDPSALVLFFSTPNSFTGQDMLELHVHGGPATVRAVLAAIPKSLDSTSSSRQIRPANPGEFTQLAFQAGRLSLPQVESLSAILTAETEQARLAATKGSSSVLTTEYDRWRAMLLSGMAELEALIDFSEDHDLDQSIATTIQTVTSTISQIISRIRTVRENSRRGELARSGILIGLIGKPNAGKSSLLNRLVGREAAIVSSQPGTTRDVVSVSVDISGWLVRIDDTAGLRRFDSASTSTCAIDSVEQEGVRRAKQQALESNVVLVMLDSTDLLSGRPGSCLDADLVALVQQLYRDADKRIVFVLNHTDRLTIPLETAITEWTALLGSVFADVGRSDIVSISCKPGSCSSSDGIPHLIDKLTSTFSHLTTALTPDLSSDLDPPTPAFWHESIGATSRQQALLEECEGYLVEFCTSTTADSTDSDGSEVDVVIAAEQLREAADCLGRITGRSGSDVEDILGVVFEKFCVGK